MAQNGPITINDASATAVTFEPTLNSNPGTFAWTDFSETASSLRPTLVGSCKTSASGVKRGRITTQLPYVDGEGAFAGFCQCEIQLLVPNDAPNSAVDDVVAFTLNAVANAILSDLIKDGKQPY